MLSGYQNWLAAGWAVFAAMLLIPQKIIHEERSPISFILQKTYNPFFAGRDEIPLGRSCCWPLRSWRRRSGRSSRLGSEFMPPLDEGDLLYMPTTDPSISVTKARQVLQQTDKLIMTFPEVVSVYGKIGRADTATDPAPLDMIESVTRLQTDPDKWRKRKMDYAFDRWPRFAAPIQWALHHTFWPAERRITMDELVYGWTDADGTDHPGLNAVVHLPGVANAWPMPIENRTNMLSTGIKTPVGIKIMGPDLQVLSDLAEQASTIMLTVPGTVSAYPERSFGGYYLDIDIDRKQAARYGLTTGDVQDVISTALGGMKTTTAVEGLERYPVNIRYARDLRDDPESIRQVHGSHAQRRADPAGPVGDDPNQSRPADDQERKQPPIGLGLRGLHRPRCRQLHRRCAEGRRRKPAASGRIHAGLVRAIRADSGSQRPAQMGDPADADHHRHAALRRHAKLVSRHASFCWPCRSVSSERSGCCGCLDYHLSLAVWVGMIALAGLDAETGLVMLLYLDNSFERFKAAGADAQSRTTCGTPFTTARSSAFVPRR